MQKNMVHSVYRTGVWPSCVQFAASCPYMCCLRCIWDGSRLISIRKWFPRRDGLQGRVECKVSWSNCLCGKTLPGFSQRSVLGHPSLDLWLLRGVYLASEASLRSAGCDMYGLHVFCVEQQTNVFLIIFSVAYLCAVLDRIFFSWEFFSSSSREETSRENQIYLHIPSHIKL